METFDDEWEAIDQELQRWDEVAFADALDRSHPLELRVTDQLMEPPMIALKAPRRSAISALQMG